MKAPAIGRWLGRFVLVLALVFACNGKAVLRAEPVAVDLEDLRRSLEAGAGEARSLEGEASSLFLTIAEAGGDELMARGPAVDRLGRVVKTAREAAVNHQDLAAFLASGQPKAPASPEALRDALSAYRDATEAFSRETSDLEGRLEALRTAPDGSDPASGWRAFIEAADRYLAGADRTVIAIAGLDRLLTFQQRRTGRVKFNLYEFVDSGRGPSVDYGLYTHVLFRDATGARNQAFIEVLRASTLRAGEVPADEAALINLFVLPVKSRMRARMADEAGSDQGQITDALIYDYDKAGALLRKACLNGDVGASGFCAGGSGGGPFLLAHETWLLDGGRIAPPLLVVDLSAVHQAAFGEFIRAVKEQVMLPDFSGGERLATLRLQLLTIILDAADWLQPIRTSLAEIVSLGAKK